MNAFRKEYLLISFLFFICCNDQTEKTVQTGQAEKQNDIYTPQNEDEELSQNGNISGEIYFYEIDSFGIDDFLGFQLSEQELAVHLKDYDWKKTPVTNKYDPEITDTNITITNNYDTIVLYHYKDKYMIEWSAIHGTEIDVYKHLRVGQSKKEIKQLFSEIDTAHSVIRVGLSGPFSCKLYFSGNKVSSIEYIGYVD